MTIDKHCALFLTMCLAFFACSSDGDSNGSYGSFEYEGQTYKTVVIGNQTWMAENLNYNVDGSVCYDNDPSNCTIYGRLYDWATAMNLDTSCNSSSCSVNSKHRGICPSGWHIPTNAEWTTLTDYVGGSDTAGRYLKATSGWNDNYSVSGNGEDTHGFAALPGGNSYSDGGFSYVGVLGNLWSASESNSGVYLLTMYYDREKVYANGGHPKSFLYSVRCLKN